ncbi:MAG: V-type ATP synthase subunit B, partial [Candidatus Thiodiazotropha sp.]
FESRFVRQSEEEDRSIDETLNLAWDLLSAFPPQALTRVNETEIAKYHRHSA